MKYFFVFLSLTTLLSLEAYAQSNAPSSRNCPKPEYPNSAKRMEIEGVTVVKFEISEEGTVSAVSIQSSSGSDELDNASIKAVKGCIFQPKFVNGVPTKQTSSLRYVWKLEGQPSFKVRDLVYQVVEKNTTEISNKNFSSFSIGELKIDNNLIPKCRFTKNQILATPINKFIQFAFNEELRKAGVYEYGKNVLTGNVKELDYSTFGSGYWNLTLELSSANGKFITNKIKIDFPVEINSTKSCDNAAEVFPKLVQQLIFEIVSNDDFKDLIN